MVNMHASGLISQNKTAIIFLDIDGVLIGERGNFPLSDAISNKMSELYGERPHTPLQYRICDALFLDQEGVDNLEKLIDLTNKTHDVGIVLISGWREDGTLEEIKTKMFGQYRFSKFIIDKTEDDNNTNDEDCFLRELDHERKFTERGLQIDNWLRKNHEKLNIGSIVILDDCDIKVPYKEHFIQIYPDILSKKQIEKAHTVLTQKIFVYQRTKK